MSLSLEQLDAVALPGGAPTALASDVAEASELSEAAKLSGVVPGAGALPGVPGGAQRLEDLAQIIQAYNRVTENLQRSHERLAAEVTRLQAELASTDAQLQRSKRLAALGEMAAGIANEIRNPLAAIGLYAGMLVEDLSRAKDRAPGGLGQQMPEAGYGAMSDTARKIADAVRGLNAVVCDVLAFARELAPRYGVLPAVGVLDRAVQALGPQIDAAGVVVRREDEKGDLAIRADADLLHQALLNLIRNAIDAMTEPRRGATAPGSHVLTLAARRDGAQVTLTVRDTGPGIVEADIDRIFNPFFTTRSTGTGLGLAIVHRIVDAHGGTIAVHNDGGAVFELSLPTLSRSRTGEEGAVANREVSLI